MVLISMELSQLIKNSESNVSRSELSKIQIDRDIRLQGKCKDNCNKHCHGVIMETSTTVHMSTLSDVLTLPQRVVLKSALKTVNNYQKPGNLLGCIFWPGYLQEYFTRHDLRCLLELHSYVEETRKQVRSEKYVTRRKVVRPIGMPDLSNQFEKVRYEAWECKVDEPNLELDDELASAITPKELLIQAVSRENNRMYDSKKLNTESVQKMLDPTGYLTSETVSYFCKMLEEQNPGNKYVFLNQWLTTAEARTLHATEINVKEANNVYFIFNKSQRRLLDDSMVKLVNFDHWGVASIMLDGKVYFGDSLYKTIPNNLKEILQDYYAIKFDRKIVKIENLSTKKYFPKQKDGHLCGFIAIMVMVLLEDSNVLDVMKYDLNLASIQANKFLIFSPSSYNCYLRQVLMNAYLEGILNRNMFLSDEDLLMIKSGMKSTLCKNRLPKKLPSSDITAKSSNPANKSSKTSIKETKSSSSKSNSKATPANKSARFSKSPEVAINKHSQATANIRENTDDNRGEIDNVVPQSDQIVKLDAKTNSNRNTFNDVPFKINNDGHCWKRKWIKNEKKKHRTNKTYYQCSAVKNEERCSAVKTVFKSNFGEKRIVEYISPHSVCPIATTATVSSHASALSSMTETNVLPNTSITEPSILEPTEDFDERNHETILNGKKNVDNEAVNHEETETANIHEEPQHEAAENHKEPEATTKTKYTESIKEVAKTHEEEIEATATLKEDTEGEKHEEENEVTSIYEEPEETKGKKNHEDPEETEETEPEKQYDPENINVEKHKEEKETSSLEESFNNEDACITENDNSLLEHYEHGREDSVKENEEEPIEFVSFKINKKACKFQRFEIKQFSTKYFIENDCVVFVNGPDGTNFDSHPWTKFHGGHGKGKGITTCCCKESLSCQLRKKKWTCKGKCDDRFCCKFYSKTQLQICLYIGKHDHEITKQGFINLKNMSETVNSEMEEDESIKAGEDEINDDESENEISSDEEEEFEESNAEPKEIKMNRYEQKLYRRCERNFEGKNIVMAKHNNIVADPNTIYILKRKKNEKISSISRDGYLYQSNTTRRQMPQILDNQGLAYLYQCNGKLACYNSECPVLNRLTVLNSFQWKKSSPNKCRFCKNNLEWEQCDGQKYVLRSTETDDSKNISKYVVIRYEESHTCGKPEPILDESVADELRILFENNSELTPSNAYKRLLEKKIREKTSYKEILSVVQAFTFDHKAKNLKQAVRKDLNGNGDDLACMLELQTFLNDMPELELILNVYTDSYICGSCDKYTMASSLGEKLQTQCDICNIEMQHTGPIILLTSTDQIHTAEQMTKSDGAFKYSTLYMDHQNNRIVNYNSFNTFIYDFHIQSICSLFTVHCKFEDRYSINLSFKLFDKVYRQLLNTEDGFKPHGFSSDNAGAISAGLRMHFGDGILHRTCSFHFLYGAYMHCSNAIGERSHQVKFLKFSWKLLEAATPNKFEFLYKMFHQWIQKSASRQKKLNPWLKFWYQRKTQWATAYTCLTVNSVNLSEAGQSKYKINNGMKRLKLYQGCIYEFGDFLLYSSRLKAMSSQNFVGKGPSREILDLRENRKAMERIKDQFMTQKDLNELFEELGIKVNEKKRKSSSQGSSKSIKKRPFMIANIDDVENALKKFKPDPKAPYTYKTPLVKNPFKSKKPGRPVGSKKKRPSRNESLTSESSLELSEFEMSDEDGTDPDGLDDELIEVDDAVEDLCRESKKRRSSQSYIRSSKRIKNKSDIENVNNGQNEIDVNPSNRKDDTVIEQDENNESIPDESHSEENRKSKTYTCSVCGQASKCAEGVRAHYVVEHVWRNFENSPIMRDSLANLTNIFEVDFTGRIKCVCGSICPSKIFEASENEEVVDFLGRQWAQVHRLVDPAHYTPSKTHRFTDVFPEGLVLYAGEPWIERNDVSIDKEKSAGVHIEDEGSDDDLSLPDIDKYSKKVKFVMDDEKQNISMEDDEEEIDITDDDDDLYFPNVLSPTETLEDDTHIESFSTDEDELVPKFKAKKDRKKDTKSFKNLRTKARAEANNYQISLKYKKESSFTFEIKKFGRAEPYSLTFDMKEVTCNCPYFRVIEERKENAANEVCKHAAMITLYCHENLRDNFNGQRWLSTRSAFQRISEMLKSFDASRNINDKKKHGNFFLYPSPIPNPTRKFPYYKRKEFAINQLKKLALPKWMAETYNRETTQGDKPSCKSCKNKIPLGGLCLRIDITSLFVNRNFKKDEYCLKMAPFRICMQINCFNDLNMRIQPRKKYKEDTNLTIVNSIDLKNIFDADKLNVKDMFKNTDVIFFDG